MEQRLQKLIADAGITSRRKAEQIILEGRVSVNGKPVSKLGSKADLEHDHVRVDGRLLSRTTEYVYLLVNKPVGYVSTVKDPQGRHTVVSLVRGIKQRVFPVGRLDYHSSGLMLLTNDGELANFLMSRASAVPRTYHVKLEGRPDPEGIAKLQTGIALDGRRTEPCQIRALGQDEKPWFEITLVEGRYHQVRRMFERIGKGVVKLKRVRIAFLTDQGLDPGEVRHLTRAEVERLKNWKVTDIKEIRKQEPKVRSQSPVVRRHESGDRSQIPVVRVQEPRVRPQNSEFGRQYPGVRPQQPVASSQDSGIRPQKPRTGLPYPGARPPQPGTGSQKFGARPPAYGAKRENFGARPQPPGAGSDQRRGRPQRPEAGSQYRGSRPQGPRGESKNFGSRPQKPRAGGKNFGARPQKPGGRTRK